MDRISAPEQNRLLGRLADMLRMTEGQAAAPEFLPPQLNVMNLVRQLMLPSAETVEKMSYGDPLFRMPQQSRIPITADKGYLADIAGMVPFAAPAARPSAQAVRNLVREIQTTSPVGAISPEIAARVIPETKIVDEKGLPKLMYHGTPKVFDEFKPGLSFVSPDQDFANKFALDNMLYIKGDPINLVQGSNVRPVYVDAKNPFDYENKKHIKTVLSKLEDNRDKKIFKEAAEKGDWKGIEKFLGSVEDAGFDSAYIKEMGQKNLAVFDSKKIKSALSDPELKGLLIP